MQRLTDMSTSELIQFAGQHSASIKEVGIYSELMKELTTRLGANTTAVTQALKERDEARLELSSAQLTISQITKVMGTSDTLSISEQVSTLNQQVVNLATENASLKSNLMFWDADNPELPYDSPEEIASECELNYNEELVVQVAAKLPNRTYRVCESWETDCKLELVEGAELQTPATDAAIANIQAQGVDMFIAHIDYPHSPVDFTHGYVDELAKAFASQLRKESNHD
ncbi:hypothetical protein M977_03790 [Buttiauxella gaviniae ATCC 51604]|uniref:Uncharacterized protein n=1 Tax=Buttiauxella gaviniae ATCC 51604 TaxID=1354253 RepID=A0A1B7HQY9_9ENTR|nr:hypothetical protein [Buttiauxella gaviniae]OAT18002.1 hypothetical protein M977_03790 [Buttiauxella gaviniae ATCC 51604]